MELHSKSPEVFKRWETSTWCGVRVSVMDIDDPLPSDNDARWAIEAVQGESSVPLQELHAEWHHSTQEGFGHDEEKAQGWLSATKEILHKAYRGQVPKSAFVCGYNA